MSARCAPHPATGFMTRRFFVRDSRPRGRRCRMSSSASTREMPWFKWRDAPNSAREIRGIYAPWRDDDDNQYMDARVCWMHARRTHYPRVAHIYIYIDLAHTEKPVAFYGLQVCARQRLALRREGVNQF